MKIFISYPPLMSEKGTAQVGQNRQFQWFKQHSVIYPMVPAYAATLLKENGFDIYWDDAIAREEKYGEWLLRIKDEKPDLVAIESKTPVIKKHWKVISDIKDVSKKTKVVLMGDHVTEFPEESLLNSKVDFVITGGDYDFSLLSICNRLRFTGKLDSGIWYRNEEEILNTGPFLEKNDLTTLPMIDRELTCYSLYTENGNYKYLPGTYTMVARDCWWGRCTFCSWPNMYKKFRSRTPKQMFDEVKSLVEVYGIKEIMDDSGTFPVGNWLSDFCRMMIKSGLSRKVRLSCNMRFGILKKRDYRMMRKAGFRFLLFGLESANQKTLDKIQKGIRVRDIREGARWAKEAGLNPHLTTMIGYPWEHYEDAERTINLAKELFEKGYADTLQATIVIPYPNTPLYKECRNKGWLDIADGAWDDFDMRKRVMKSSLTESEIKELTSSLYKLFFKPKYIINQFLAIRSWPDASYIIRGFWKVIGKHLKDFSRK